ncbi:asparagine synthase (glutamine-hydrolyzing) [Candidatus Pelagibacter sp.]|jgi:asparagine synthase (glutamine-hydrolysing)|nr:asparagine synthase (glutamine-hydrolyzing) [Candidatus Pelagibacter sp.]
MCGIVGILDPSNKIDKKVNLIKLLNKYQEHRGPDDSGYFNNNHVSLGFQRLSIIDIINGNQPIIKENTVTIFNGEIYNFKNLRKELIHIGAKFNSNSDSEVVANAFLYWGISCLKKFDGMFSICFYNLETQDVYLARDRMGIKPLHYVYFNKALFFSSELRTLINIPGFKKTPNFNALSSYLSFRYPISDQSLFFNDIKKIPSGSFLHFDLKKKEEKIINYWKLPELNTNDISNLSEDKLIENLDFLLNNSVKKQLVSDVPIGVLLSGGLDSSLIASIASKFNKNLKTFSVSFEETDYDESKKAELVSKYISSNHQNIRITKNLFIENLQTVIDVKSVPASIPHEFALHYLSKKIKKDVSVLLSGEGADEFFGGYSRVQKSPFDYNKHSLFKKFDKNNFFNFFLDRYKWFSIEEKNRLFSSDTLAKINSNAVLQPLHEIFNICDKKNTYNTVLKFFQKIHIKCLLDRLDLMTMNSGIEARVPFLDHKVIEFINGVPFKYKIKWKSSLHKYLSIFSTSTRYTEKNDINKYLLRSCSKKYLPNITKNEKKLGFPLPMNDWMKDKRIEEIYMDKSHLERGIFDKDYLLKLYNFNKKVEPNSNFDFSGKKIWMLINIELWMRKFF